MVFGFIHQIIVKIEKVQAAWYFLASPGVVKEDKVERPLKLLINAMKL